MGANLRPDVIVIGLGAAGAATLYQLSRRGAAVLGIDRHHPPHDLGSSHGESRVTRQALGEGDDYVPLALRSHELWRQIEAESGEALMLTTGGLFIGALDLGGHHRGKEDFLRRTVEIAARHRIAHEVLTADEARRRFPPFNVREGEVAYFEPGAGLLFPERCVAAQLALARRRGAKVRAGERVTAILPIAGGVRVVTDQDAYEAGQAVVAAGAWTPGLLGGAYGRSLGIYRQLMHWFEPDDAAAFAPDRFPVFMWMHGTGAQDWFYGFPVVPGSRGVKVSVEQFAAAAPTPEAIDRAVSAGDAEAMHSRHVAGRLVGLSNTWLRSAACLYTMAPDSRFLIGSDPVRERTIVISACSGHGFKHSPAIGEAVARLALDGAPPSSLAPFAIRV
ncbi:MAG: N-methyl-L-tryptophan oxidase [Caulobacteraceae bacterium]